MPRVLFCGLIYAGRISKKRMQTRLFQEKALRLMMKVLLSIKASQIDEVVSRLDTDQIDTLMKYVYKGFEYPSDGSSAHLLIWHEKAFAVGGLGCIIRVLTDNKRV